jgi:hypothetical protein
MKVNQAILGQKCFKESLNKPKFTIVDEDLKITKCV